MLGQSVRGDERSELARGDERVVEREAYQPGYYCHFCQEPASRAVFSKTHGVWGIEREAKLGEHKMYLCRVCSIYYALERVVCSACGEDSPQHDAEGQHNVVCSHCGVQLPQLHW